MAEDEPMEKKIRTESCIYTVWSQIKERQFLKEVINNVCLERKHGLAALRITTCDAGGGVPFDRASCITQIQTDEYFPFGSIFLRGFEMLRSFVKYDKIPEDTHLRVTLEKLLLYLVNKETQKCVVDMVLKSKDSSSGTDTPLAEVLTEHLFSKLSPSSTYTLDEKMTGKDTHCSCGCKTDISGHYGNTGLGNPSCWHGNADILLNDLCVVVQHEPDSQAECECVGYPGGKPGIKGKNNYCTGSIEDLPTKSRSLSQTIVFSFLQRQKQKRMEHGQTLIPCIGISRKEVIFYFYDSEHDILLQSKGMQLVTHEREISYEAVLALWLVLNYQCLASGLSENMLKSPKSGFYKHAEENIHLYENELSIGSDIGRINDLPFNPGCASLHYTRFVWPSQVSNDF